MASRARKNRRGVKKRQPFMKFLMALGIFVILIGVGGVAAFGVGAMWLQDLPDYEDASAYNYSEKTKIYASDGTTLLAELYLENRDPVTLDQISPYVLEGTVATEDERFYEHNGIDVAGIARALVVNLTGTGYEGASTITQQFVRNTVLADEATENSIKRKVREAYIALKLEEMYSKDDILLMYLNTINYGQGAYGIEAAAELYFSKPASDLTIAEAATLIGIPQSPTYNNPVDNPDNCLQRRNLVLDRMLSYGCISQEEHDAAQQEPITLNLTISDSNDGLYQYPYFTSYVRDQLLEEYSSDEVFKGGMTVITTLDVDTQNKAQQAADAKLSTVNDNIELAMIAVDPDTGYIRAMIGGRDYNADEFNLSTQAQRQPGSSFKTFTLLAALDEGISPQTNLDCSAHVEIDGWEVSNIGNADYGVRTLASAFAVSSNTGFARLVTEIGPEKVVDMAHTCGIESDLQAVPSITLGAEEVTVREMAQAYATIANGGTMREAVAIQEIRDSEGNTIFTADTTGEQVLDTNLTAAATQVMEGVVTSGTGRGAAISNGQPAGGKTGTSENYRDKWFCGITPQLSVAIWMGGRTEVEMPTSVACDDVFGDFMSAVLEGQPIEQFPEGDGELEYTITDLGEGSGSEGNEEENPEHEGEEVEETPETPAPSETPGGETEPGGGTEPDGGEEPGDGEEPGGGEESGGGTEPGGGGEGGDTPGARTLSLASPAMLSQMGQTGSTAADGFALLRYALQALIAV